MLAVMRFPTAWIGCCLALLPFTLAAPVLHAQNHFCACMIGNEPVQKDTGLTMYVYQMASTTGTAKSPMEALIEKASSLLMVPGEVLRFDVSKTAVYMQCRFLQAVGVATIGKRSDYSPLVLKDLIELPLSTIDDVEYYLFFNALHPKVRFYTGIVAANMALMKESGNGIENRDQ